MIDLLLVPPRSLIMIMSPSKALFAALALLCLVHAAHGHGWLAFPESRNSRLNAVAPAGLQYNRMNGNGRAAYLSENGIINQPKVCGDAFQALTDSQLGNYFATRITTATGFTAGQRVRFSWQLTANHGGFLAFKICNRNTNLDQACFDSKPLFRADGLGRRTYIFVQNGASGSPCHHDGVCTGGGNTFGVTITTPEYTIPSDIVCSGGCVLQVEYYTYNSCWLPCENSGQCTSGSLSYLNNNNPATGQRNLATCNMGSTSTIGNGERFYNCADIAINGGSTGGGGGTGGGTTPTCTRTAAPGGGCGSGICCSSGQCCSQWGWCGTTPSHCGAGCQRSFGTCTSAVTAASADGRPARRRNRKADVAAAAAAAPVNSAELAAAMFGDEAAAANLAAAAAAPAMEMVVVVNTTEADGK